MNDEESDGELDFRPALPKDLKHVPLVYEKLSIPESIERSNEFYKLMNKRRTVRHFSEEKVPIDVIRNIIRTAGNII